MGRVALLEKRHEDAEGHFKKALEIDPESSVAMNNLGATFLETRKHGEAVRFFWNALRSHSRSSTVQHNLRRALVGHFAHSPFLLGAVAAPPLLMIGLKTGVVEDEHRAFQVFWLYSLALGTAWIGAQVFRHRSLPLGVRDYLWRAVHLPFWAGLRDLVVFCGIVSSVFHGIYLYLWWSRGSHWAPGSPLTWSLFAAFTLWIVACYLQVVSEWLRRRRGR